MLEVGKCYKFINTNVLHIYDKNMFHCISTIKPNETILCLEKRVPSIYRILHNDIVGFMWFGNETMVYHNFCKYFIEI